MNRLTCISLGLLTIAFGIPGCATGPSGSSRADWIPLIDGAKGLDNWNRVGTANWRAADGVIEADRSEQGAGFLVSKNSYTDFEIRAEFWVSDDANSGIFMRCSDPGKITDKTCYEANIFDQRPDPDYGTGAIVHIAKVIPMPKAGGKWNSYQITARGPQLTVTLNGVRTVEVQDSKLTSGPIAVQWGKGTVKFRKLEIRPL